MGSLDEYRIKLLATNQASPELIKLSKQFEQLGGKDALLAQKSLNKLNKDIETLERQGGKASVAFSRFTQGITLGNIAADAASKIISKLGDAMSFVGDSIVLAARVDVLNNVFEMTGKRAGYSAEQLGEYKKQIVSLGITQKDTLGILQRFIQGQLDLSEATKIARVAQDAAVIAGVNSSEAAITLTDAILKQQPVLLKQFGIITELNEVYAKQAKELGKNANDLTEVEKRQGFVNEIMRQSVTIAGSYTSAMEMAGKRLTSLPRYVEEFQVSLGKVFQAEFAGLIDLTTSALKGLTEIFDDLDPVKAAERMREHEAALKAEKIAAEQAAEALRKYNEEFKQWANANNVAFINGIADSSGGLADKLKEVETAALGVQDAFFAIQESDIKKNLEGYKISYDGIGKAANDATKVIVGGLDSQALAFRDADADAEAYTVEVVEGAEAQGEAIAETTSYTEKQLKLKREYEDKAWNDEVKLWNDKEESKTQALVAATDYRQGLAQQEHDGQVALIAEQDRLFNVMAVAMRDNMAARVQEEERQWGELAALAGQGMERIADVINGDLSIREAFERIFWDFVELVIEQSVNAVEKRMVPGIVALLSSIFDTPKHDRAAMEQGRHYAQFFSQGALEEFRKLQDNIPAALKSNNVGSNMANQVNIKISGTAPNTNYLKTDLIPAIKRVTAQTRGSIAVNWQGVKNVGN